MSSPIQDTPPACPVATDDAEQSRVEACDSRVGWSPLNGADSRGASHARLARFDGQAAAGLDHGRAIGTPPRCHRDRHGPNHAMQWCNPPPTLLLGPGEIHLWLALRGDAPPTYTESAGLTIDEIARARRLQRPADRELYLLAHVMLRDVLAHYLSLTPLEIVLNSAAHGKPFLAGSHCTDLHFNLSHSGDAVLCALTRGREIGVDIEAAVPSEDLLSVAAYFFAPDEYAALAARNGDDRVALFYLLWTRKEAYLKACGKGHSHPLNAFSVMPSLEVPPDPVVRGPDTESEEAWFCYGLPAPLGCAAATVIAGAASALSCWRWGI